MDNSCFLQKGIGAWTKFSKQLVAQSPPDVEAFVRNELLHANDGNFYGTTRFGGSPGNGTIFKLVTDGTSAGSVLTTLFEFAGTNGNFPRCELIELIGGSFHGTTSSGGQFGQGTVFILDTDGTAGNHPDDAGVVQRQLQGRKPGIISTNWRH